MRHLGALVLPWLPLETRPLALAVLHLADAWTTGRVRWSPRSRPVLIAAVLLVLAALPALAYASPPDPSWIPGLYDDADYDDVIVLATAGVAWVDPDLAVDLRPILVRVADAVIPPAEFDNGRPALSVRPRAPPGLVASRPVSY